jgi:hypothetical protein
MESRSSITITIHNVEEKQNPWKSKKSTTMPWTDAGVAFVYGVQCIISMKDSEGCILVSAHASTVYAVGRIKSKTKQD